MLVEQAAMPKGVIVEINIVDENGKVIVSSIPSRKGQPAPVRESLASFRMPGFLGPPLGHRDIAKRIMKRACRWVCSVIPDQEKPVFEIQLLVSSILLRDKIMPDLEESAHRVVVRVARRASTGGSFRASGTAAGQTDWQGHRYPIDRQAAWSHVPEDEARGSGSRRRGVQTQPARRTRCRKRRAMRNARQTHRQPGARRAHEIKNPLNAIALRLETLRHEDRR